MGISLFCSWSGGVLDVLFLEQEHVDEQQDDDHLEEPDNKMGLFGQQASNHHDLLQDEHQDPGKEELPGELIELGGYLEELPEQEQDDDHQRKIVVGGCDAQALPDIPCGDYIRHFCASRICRNSAYIRMIRMAEGITWVRNGLR